MQGHVQVPARPEPQLRQAHIDAILPRATKRAALGKKEALLKLVQPAGERTLRLMPCHARCYLQPWQWW